jgi:hypothetical protein
MGLIVEVTKPDIDTLIGTNVAGRFLNIFCNLLL